MSGWVQRGRACAQGLVRFEIVILSGIYLYYVVSDIVPLVAWALLAAIWAARWWTQGRPTRTTPLDLPIAIILLCLPFSLWVSTDWWLSLPKVYGVVLSVAYYYAVVNAIATRHDLGWAAVWLVITCLFIGVAGLLGTDWAQGKILSATFVYDRLPRFIQGIPRSIAGGFARNGVGGTLTLVVPLLAGLVLARGQVVVKGASHKAPAGATGWRAWVASVDMSVSQRFRLLAVLTLIVTLTTLALTQSRGGILGTAVGLAAVAIWKERRLAWTVAAAGLVLALLLLAGRGPALADFLLRMDAKSGTLASRIEVWQRGLLMTQDYPYTGIGIGTYNNVAHAMYPFFIAASDEVVAHAHNNLLETAVDLGIPGLVAFCALLTGFAVCLVRAYRPAQDEGLRALIAGVGAGMLAHQVFGLTDAFIVGTKPGVLVWVFLAMAVVMYRGAAQGWRPEPA